jgi:hypothetical protein
MPTLKPKAKGFTTKRMLLAAGLVTVLVVAYILHKKKQAATAAQAAYSQDTSGGLPGQNYLPATGIGGASQLGQGVAAPPPTACPGGGTPLADGTCPTIPTGSCPDGSTPDPNTGQCPTTTPPPPASGGSYRHDCLDGPGPGCGGPNRHCEYRYVAGDTGGQPAPPPDCIPQSGQPSGPSNQSGTVAPGAAPVTSDVLSSQPTAPNSFPPASPGLVQPTATVDSAARLLHVTQYVGRGAPSNPWQFGGESEPEAVLPHPIPPERYHPGSPPPTGGFGPPGQPRPTQ